MGILKKALATKVSNRVVGPGVDISHSMLNGLAGREINSDYENIYPTARKAEQAFAKIRPYAIDDRGERIPPPRALQKIYRPNKSMGAYRFRLALASMYLMHDNTYIRVHYSGDELREDNITGFTFIENTQPSVQGNKYVWHLPSGHVIDDSEVLTIPSGVNPFYVSSGFSNARAVRRWSTLDDYIIDYQSAFFRNGAIPAGQFVITAPTVAEYNNIKQKMKEAHQGADKANNVIYSHRPTDEDGKANAATVEWVGYDQKNKDLAVRELVDATRDRVESVTGVPKQMTGLIEDSHYNGVRLAEYITTEYVARPMAMEIWDAFTHELNRVTGGTGYAITFDLETPIVQDEEKVRSERKQIDMTTLGALLDRGITLESAVAALDYPTEYLKLEIQEVDEDEQEEVTSTDEDLPSQDPELQRSEKSAEKQVVSKQTEADRETDPELESQEWQRQVRLVAQQRLNDHVNQIVADTFSTKSSKQIEATEEDNSAFRDALLLVLLPILTIRGLREYRRNQGLVINAGLDASGTSEWVITEAVRTRYAEYLERVATSYNAETAERARRILTQARAEGLSAQEIRGRLNQMPELDGYRAERLARSEVHRTQGRASVESMMQIKDQTGFTIKKTWRVRGSNPCEWCRALDGTTVDVDQNFINKGDTVTGVDGGTFTNDFVGAESADLHPNDECQIEYEVSA